MTATAHTDTFVRDNLPAAGDLPVFLFDLPELRYPSRLNASNLLDRALAEGLADKPAVVCGDLSITYGALLAATCQIAHVLADDLGLAPGCRVLLHGANRPLVIATWFAIARAGGVVVATMPMLRAEELATIVRKARISHAIAEAGLRGTVEACQALAPELRHVAYFGEGGDLEDRMAAKPADFSPVDTAADDPVLIAFTSGTTGVPKGCVHFHRDILAMVDTFARHILRPGPDDVFCGTPPMAFTFGLGGCVIFPLAFGATTALCEAPGYEGLCATIQRHGVTTLFTAPTTYRALIKSGAAGRLSSLTTCVSAGETLPRATSDAWFEATGIRIIDGIGSTEMIHIFISASEADIRPGSTGKATPGYQAELLSDDGGLIEGPGEGRLAVRGPTGCRYLADERQKAYVVNGWNVTGDIYRRDADGYFWYVARGDDMIVSSGYNIGAPEVEHAILGHPEVAEAAVVGAPDEDRGQICKAFVVLAPGAQASDALARDIQGHVKRAIAPYKYPRAVVFVAELPKTASGKLQRFKLRRP
ncbi:MAG: AMP-binding protein [Pseudomonadota bacterium]|nr:AMP-binding protein [Pseudomonadota bacterium]